MDKNRKARFQFIISMIAFGTLSLFIKNIDLGSGEIALYRAVLAALLLCGLFILRGKEISFKGMRKELGLLVISGAAMGFNWIFLFQAYKYTTVSLATISYFFAPVIVTILCPILFKEKMTLRQFICFMMSTVGVVLVLNVNSNSSGGTDIIGILYGLGGACFYASVILLNKFIKNVSGIERTFLQFISAIFVLVPYVALTEGFNITSLNTISWVNLLIVGLFHTGIIYCLYFSSLKEMKGQEVAVLSYVDPLVAIMVSVVILKENISLLQIIGGLLILGFTLWNELGAEKQDKSLF